MDPRELDVCVTGCARAHQHLLETLDRRLTASTLDVTAPSLLPEWTVGHVLAHLVGNAEAFIGVIEAAARGEVTAMYPGGVEGRRADIEARATQSADRLVMDVRRSIWALEGVWASCTAQGWQGRGSAFGGTFPVADVPLRRWREVTVHHSDLGWGFEPQQWDLDYVSRDVATFARMWVKRNPDHGGDLPAAALTLPPAVRLAWLLGRMQPPGLPRGLDL